MTPLKTTVHFLAHTRTGKTCFTAGMYAKFRRKPKNFRLYALGPDHEPDDDLDLDLTEMWANIKAQVYPERTVAGDELNYHFELQHNKTPFIHFDWLDYRGEVLSARKSASDHAVFRSQIDKVRQDGCIFFGISAEHLLKSIEKDTSLLEEVKESAWVDRMDHLTKDLPASTPAVFVITKADLPGYERRSFRGVLDDLKSMFPDWLGQGSKRLALICPVSVVSGENLEAPIIFATWARMHRELRSIGSQHSDAYNKYNKNANGIINWINYYIDDAHRSTVDRLESEKNEAWRRYQTMVERLKPLSEYITPLTAFFDGRELSEHDKHNIYSLSF